VHLSAPDLKVGEIPYDASPHALGIRPTCLVCRNPRNSTSIVQLNMVVDIKSEQGTGYPVPHLPRVGYRYLPRINPTADE